MGREAVRTSRRDLLAAAAGGASALAAQALASPLSVAAASTAVMTEVDNQTQAETSITIESPFGDNDVPSAAFTAKVTVDGVALRGYSPSGAGVVGDSDASVGVVGRSGASGTVTAVQAGVYGTGMSGVAGDGQVGVDGFGDIGVVGVGRNGVAGVGDGLGPPGLFGTGVYGYSGTMTPPAAPNNIGVYARGDGASTALRVQGKATFSRSGRAYVGAGHYSRTITLAGVTTSSLILATLQTRRTGVYIAAAVPAAGKFTVYLNKAVTATTYFAYFVLN
jgi:hypothetical protein